MAAFLIAYLCIMKIFKSNFIIAAIIIAFVGACNTETKPKETTTGETNKVEANQSQAAKGINKQTSSIKWEGSDPAKTHTGTIAISSGEMKFDNAGKLTGGSIAIDMNTITVDDKTPEEKKPNLIKHLKSNDFFAADSFPTSNFEIAEISNIEGDKYNVKGNLTLRGTTLGVEIPATITTVNGVTTFKADFSLDRTKWRANYHAKGFDASIKDKFIDNMFQLHVEIISE